MSWIVAIIVGAFIGWIASLIMKTDQEQGAFANIIIGIVGSLLGKYIFADVLGIGGAEASGTLSLGGVLWGVAGAVLLVGILKALKVMQ